MLAVCACCVPSPLNVSDDPAFDVLPSCHGLQVPRICTCPIPAQVVDDQTLWDRPPHSLVRDPVRTKLCSLAVFLLSPDPITIRVPIAGPFNTRVLFPIGHFSPHRAARAFAARFRIISK